MIEVSYSQRCRRLISCRGFGGVHQFLSPPTYGGLTGGSVIVSPFQGGFQGVSIKIMNRKETGAIAENIAADYLSKRGYKIRERNYRTREGEIDIIAEKDGTLVFVEV